MKKSLICVAAAAVMICAAATSYAAEENYASENNSATFAEAAGKSTVVIYKGNGTPTQDNIVYVNQASSTFDASTEFLLKADPDPGLYTVKFGGSSGSAQKSTFYIGMIDTNNDVKLNMIDGEGGYKAVGDKYNIGYRAEVSLTDYKSLIIKKSDGTYMGCENPLSGVTLTGGGTVDIGI